MSIKTAVLLTNLGTPNSLDRAAVKSFLKQFLSDRRVVEIPRLPWWLILNGIILPLRSGKSLQGYQRIWSDDGSPLMAYSLQQQTMLQQKLGEDITVALAMRYGNPSFETVVNKLMASGLERLIVFRCTHRTQLPRPLPRFTIWLTRWKSTVIYHRSILSTATISTRLISRHWRIRFMLTGEIRHSETILSCHFTACPRLMSIAAIRITINAK